MKFLTSIMLLLILFTSSFSAALETEPNQKAALLDLYNGTNGANWTRNDNWTNGDPCYPTETEWEGLKCSWNQDAQYFYISKLELANNNLVGQLQDSIGNLWYVSFFYMSDNSLTGSIPSTLGNISAVEVWLDSNQLTGDIPDNIWTMNNLNYLTLRGNQLSGTISSSISSSSLDRLDLAYNKLTGKIPAGISNSNLTELFLSNNRSLFANEATQNYINSRPYNDAGNIHNGSNIYGYNEIVYSNSLRGVHVLSELYNSTNGASWTNKTNWLIGDPCLDDWANVYCNAEDTQITKLYLHQNNIVGKIPKNINQIGYLEELRLNENSLVGNIPKKIGNLSHLSNLLLNQNNLVGEIPKSITNSSSIGFLKLENNSYLYTDKTLVQDYLNTQNNHYQTVLTTNTITNSEQIALIKVYEDTNGDDWTNNSNWLVGDSCVNNWYGVNCSASYITELNLQSNNLTGNIPIVITNLDYLTNLNLSDNNLTGEIPEGIKYLRELQSIYLVENYYLYSEKEDLIDFIDDKADMDGYYSDILSTNRATDEEKGLIRLYYNTDGNNWINDSNWNTGNPCGWFGVYCYEDGVIHTLSLENNSLSGDIPTQITNLLDLENLSLHHNNLTGEIPAQISTMSHLVNIALSNNELTGNIPSGLGSLVHLNAIELAYNNLTGDIPTDIGNLSTNLEYISLRNNNLTGNIPSEFGSITTLLNLTIGYNKLSGNIPIEITVLDNLTNIWLENNCHLYSKESEEDSIRSFINTVQNHGAAYQTILDTNTNDCSDSLVPIIMYLLN